MKKNGYVFAMTVKEAFASHSLEGLMTTKTRGPKSISKKVTVWIVDDSERYCKAVVAGLTDNPYLNCQRYFRSAESLLAALSEEPDPPSVVLLDVEMPGIDGLEAISMVRRSSLATRVIMLTCHEDEVYVREALQEGASGYLKKPSSPSEIENAVRAALMNLVSIGEDAIKKLIPKRESEVLMRRLTPREKQVYRLVAEGLSRKEIAKRLSVSSDTVHFHLQNIYLRLAIHNRSEVIRGAPGRE